MATTANGIFKIESWEETDIVDYEHGGKMTKASITQTYTGDIQGRSEIQFLMIHNADKSASFVGYETVTCTIAGREGSFVLQHDGTFSIGVASSRFAVVSGSGRGGLMNISGEGQFASTDGGEAEYSFDYLSDSGDDQAGSQ